ncbi:MAG: glycosyltransferase 87 family protein [Candidatus Limnocylindrales bacterium]
MTARSTGFSAAFVAASQRPNVQRVLALGAIVGLLMGVETLVLHLAIDPLVDVHAYYDAGARLNAGEPLYVQSAGTNDAAFYRYPPLLAIAFRPLALLPFAAAAAVWEAVLVGLFVLTIVRLGPRRRWTWLALGMLALPTGWSLAIGQAQVAVTLLMALGAPWALALATNLKLLPALVAIWWIGRRDVRSLGWFALWTASLGLLQIVLEPAGSLAFPGFLGLDQVGAVANVSPYAISPILWVILLVAGGAAAWRLAPTRWGWMAAIALSVLATPRLLVYQLSSLVAAVRDPSVPDRGPAGLSR